MNSILVDDFDVSPLDDASDDLIGAAIELLVDVESGEFQPCTGCEYCGAEDIQRVSDALDIALQGGSDLAVEFPVAWAFFTEYRYKL